MNEPEFPEGSWSILRLPRSHWHCQLGNFEWRAVRPRATRGVISWFLEKLEAGGSPHLLMTGDPGIGKSHLGVALYRQAIRLYGTALVSWINVPKFCQLVKSQYGQPGNPFDDYEAARRLVVLDDLFGRDLSSHEISQIVYHLIDTAYQNGAAVVLNQNAQVEELSTHLRPHEVSRILAGAKILPMSADEDWRRRRA